MFYAGIGSRKTSQEVLKKFEQFAYDLAKKNLVLRSGGADGADSAFERGCDLAEGKKEIFLPWKSFNENPSSYFNPPHKAFKLAAQLHPWWEKLSSAAQNLHARNCQQILGKDLNQPVKFIICYTPLDKGGTLQALRVACLKKIPYYNFYVKEYDLDTILAQHL